MAYPNTAPTYEYLDGLNADGTILGQTSAKLIGFWGATPSARVAFSAASVSGATTATIVTSALVQELKALVNEIRAAMVSMGLKA
jgi:hypothetical protein